jgi:hypothetical protein
MKHLLIVLALLFTLPSYAGVYRDSKQVKSFRANHACPATKKVQKTCPGYIVDHVIALDCGGRDLPSNMQYQTLAAAKAKDKWERSAINCKHPTKAKPPL